MTLQAWLERHPDDPELQKKVAEVWQAEEELLPGFAEAALVLTEVYDRKARRWISDRSLTQESWDRRRSLRKRRLALEPRRHESRAALSLASENAYDGYAYILVRAERHLKYSKKRQSASRVLRASELERATHAAEVEEAERRLRGLAAVCLPNSSRRRRRIAPGSPRKSGSWQT